MKSEEIMIKDCLLSELEHCERTNCNGGGGGSAFNNNCGGPQACQEYSEIFKSLKHLDKMHELVKPLETLTERMCQQYQDNTLSMKDASIIVQSIMQHGFITLEYDMSNRENSNEDLTPRYEGDHIEDRTTLHKDSFHMVECNSRNGDNCDGEISTECGKLYMRNSKDGAHSLNYSGAQESEFEESVETFTHNMHLKGLAVINSDFISFQHSECRKTLIENGSLETQMLTNPDIRLHQCEECGRTFTQERG
ncbi:zinc finger protein 1-like isoform X3 [Ptychodera flava]|uniref:zinc finger protein 1-like isoform X3 n=1 Tax=Ptychodera flava TaxID=63121 RepID=UPI003969FF05